MVCEGDHGVWRGPWCVKGTMVCGGDHGQWWTFLVLGSLTDVSTCYSHL